MINRLRDLGKLMKIQRKKEAKGRVNLRLDLVGFVIRVNSN